MEEPAQEFEDIEFEDDEAPESGKRSFQVDAQTIIGGCLIGLLLVVGLMLPPVALGRRVFGFGYQRITANNPTAEKDGLTVGLESPDGSLRVKLGTISAEAFSNQRAGSQWHEAQEAVPPTLQLASPVYEIDGRGEPTSTVLLDVTVGSDVTFSDKLDLYRWDAEQGKWVFVPHHEDPSTSTLQASLDRLPGPVAVFSTSFGAPILTIVQEPGQSLDPELGAAANVLMPAGLQPAQDGSLTGEIATGAVGDFTVLPLVRNYSSLSSADTATVSAILADTNVQQAHLDALVNLVVAGGNDGVALDYRGLTVEQQPAYTAFISALASMLHDEGKVLAVTLPPPTPGPDPMTWDTGGYDWQALGAAADMVEVVPALSPGDYTASRQGGQVLAWATGEVNRYKMHLGLTTLSVEVGDGFYEPISYNNALKKIEPELVSSPAEEGESYPVGERLEFMAGGSEVDDIGIDPDTGMYRYVRVKDVNTEVWIMTAAKLRERLALANTYNLAGVVVHDLLSGDAADGVEQTVVGYKVSAPLMAQSEFEMQWVVKDSDGQTIQFDTLAIGDSFTFLPSSDDEFTIELRILDPEEQGSSAWSFIVGAGKQEEEEEEEEEEEPAPAPESAPEPAPAAAPVAPTTASGGFELGGQTHSLANPDLMHQAGMTWVKFQEKWTPGASGYDVAGDVELAHASGFKVLFSIPGPPEPESIDFNAYVQYVREVAETGADGIEIWNEMNLSREWPRGDISGTSYVNNMLAPAYNAIKGVDPGILVISGALAPTGAFGGGCGDLGWVAGCDDYVYVQQMANAGAANYMDCMGVHFNAGATSPSASSGHPAGTAPGWYFWGTVNTYTPLGKPICFTELGFLSDDGYASVEGTNFGWGAGTTVGQHAEWLAEAVNLSKSFARLLIVWNVDIFTYDPTDPQGGYAIIRPDGSCPACDTLAAVAP